MLLLCMQADCAVHDSLGRVLKSLDGQQRSEVIHHCCGGVVAWNVSHILVPQPGRWLTFQASRVALAVLVVVIFLACQRTDWLNYISWSNCILCWPKRCYDDMVVVMMMHGDQVMNKSYFIPVVTASGSKPVSLIRALWQSKGTSEWNHCLVSHSQKPGHSLLKLRKDCSRAGGRNQK